MGVEDEPAAGGEDAEAFFHFRADLVRCAEGQGLLGVNAAAPEDELVTELRF